MARLVVKTKNCKACERSLPLKQFYSHNQRGRVLYSSRCRPCHGAQSMHNRIPEQTRAHDLKRRFGLTVEEYDAILAAQGGVCAGCGRCASEFKRRLSVDHDHKCCPGRKSCGKCIRGLLCTGCNRTLGVIGDDPIQLRALAAYLETHGG